MEKRQESASAAAFWNGTFRKRALFEGRDAKMILDKTQMTAAELAEELGYSLDS